MFWGKRSISLTSHFLAAGKYVTVPVGDDISKGVRVDTLAVCCGAAGCQQQDAAASRFLLAYYYRTCQQHLWQQSPIAIAVGEEVSVLKVKFLVKTNEYHATHTTPPSCPHPHPRPH